MKIITIILTNLIFISTLSQTTVNDDCFTNNNPKTKVTNFTYPFNKANRILIVKYKAAAVQNINRWDTTNTGRTFPKKNDDIDTTNFLSKMQLTDKGIDSLIEIINQRSKDNKIFEGIFGEPSNAILFIDNKEKVFEYVVVGFAQVDKLKHYTEMTSSIAVNLGWWCSDKGQILVDFFQKRGVETVIRKWE